MTDKIVLVDEAHYKTAIHDVRDDNKPEDWIILTLEAGSKNRIIVHGSGFGGIEEFKRHLHGGAPAWGIVRMQETVEKSATEKITVVKFVYIQWLPDDTPMMIKANLGVLKGQITKLLEPMHVDFLFDKTDEIDEISIRAKLRDAAGTSDKTRARDHDREDTPVVGGKPLGGTGQQQGAKPVKGFEPIKTSGLVKYADKEAIASALNSVRDSASSVNWCLIGYVRGTKDTLELRASGSGGADELSGEFKDDEVLYSITKVADQIDVSATVKYVVVHWLGPNTPIMHKAKVGTMKGEVDNLLGQRHISIDCSSREEISTDIFANLVGKTSGSKSNVKE